VSSNPYAPPSADEEPFDDADAGPLPLASRSQRLGGAILDGLLYLPFLGVAFLLARELHISIQDRISYMVLFWGCMAPLAVYQWMLTARSGQTLGKRWVKTRIVKLDDSPVDFVTGVALRAWIPLVVTSFPNWTGTQELMNPMMVLSLVNHLFIFGDAHRCLHDYLAGTRVVALRVGTGLLG
jgi:uncharacterized RDD family membrane protein YckC